jgi:hypothetical protein
MSFIQIGFLGALAALAIPIVIHLVFRQRPKRVELGTLRFLRVVLEHNARRRRVMRWLLLALRMACIAMLALLFARPYLLAARDAGQKQTVAILIDRSATMEVSQDGQRAIDRAVAEAQSLLRTALDNTRFEIAFFDHAVHPLAAPLAEGERGAERRDVPRSELLKRLKAPAACYGATDYGAAMEWARDVLAKAPPGPRQLHVFTDFQRSGLVWSEVDALPEDVATHLHDLGRSAVNNIAVTEARLERSWIRPDEQTSLHVTVYNGGPFTTAETPIVLKLTSGSRTIELREQAKLEPGALVSLRFDLPPAPEGLWQGTVSVEAEDDLPHDNHRHVALSASPPYQVLLVDGREAASPILASTYFLETALRLAEAGELFSPSPFEPRRISTAEAFPKLEGYDVVVLSDAGNLDPRDAREIAEFVLRGGGLLVFCGENVDAGRTASLEAAGLNAGAIAGIHRANDLPLRLRRWDAAHPIFSAFSDPQLGDLQRLAFSACTKITPAKDAEVLAEFDDSLPAVIERRVGAGSVIWFASSCDRQWSDWTRSRLYLPLVHQLVGHQSGFLAGGKVRYAVLEVGREPHEAAEPGIHAHEGYTLVVNGSPRESETERCSTEEFADRFGLILADAAAPADAVPVARAAAGDELIDSEIWPLLATLLLGLVLAEGLVANRTAA